MLLTAILLSDSDFQLLVEDSVKMIVMDALRFSALTVLSVWMYRLQELVLSVDHVLKDTQEIHPSAMVHIL